MIRLTPIEPYGSDAIWVAPSHILFCRTLSLNPKDTKRATPRNVNDAYTVVNLGSHAVSVRETPQQIMNLIEREQERRGLVRVQ